MAKRTKRTDLHRPSVIIPADYTFVACNYQGISYATEMEFTSDRAIFRAHMERTGGKFAHIERDRGGCDICGAYCSYTARFYHEKSNTYIVTGLDCAEKMGIDNPAAFRSFKKKVAAGIKAQRGKTKAQEVLAAAGLTAAWTVYTTPYVDLPRSTKRYHENEAAYEEATIVDIVSKLVRYGSITEGQTRFIGSLLVKIEGRAAEAAQRDAKRAAEAAAAQPVPVTTERVKVTGEIITIKEQDGQFGPVTKMLVKCPEGFKLWGTVPRELSDAGAKDGDYQLRGKVVEFSAKIERSKDDDKFGFFSRPTKARVIAPGVCPV